MSNKLEYIASGCSYLRLNAPRNVDGENLEFLQEGLGSVQKKTNHDFGILYNAYIESRFGEPFQNYRGRIKSIHADSGGLQMITQGKKITKSDKEKIFKNQGTYADYAMSFDENPVVMLSEKSERTNVTNRRFDYDVFCEAARNTGKNIRDQIEAFDKMGSETKPIFIAQGNDYDTYMKWTELALNEIPKDMQSSIGSVALGASAIGYGFLEDIERAAYFKFLPIDCKHQHVLGVGSFRRLLPYLIFRTSGYYDDDIHISYDSTTHTSGVELGLYFLKEKSLKFTRAFDQKYKDIYEDILTDYQMEGIDVREFHRIMNNGYTKYVEEKNGECYDFLRVRTSFILKSIVNFCRMIDRIDKDKDLLLKTADQNKLFKECYSLFGVKDKDDFDLWYRNSMGNTKSKKVSSDTSGSLEDFF